MNSELNHILRNKDLVNDLMNHLHTDEGLETLENLNAKADDLMSAVESLASGQESQTVPHFEAIIRKYGRPVLYIKDGKIQDEAVLPLWKQRLTSARKALEAAIPSVGRIELRGHPRYPWVGTGWHVAPRVIVTNRHVAETFARNSDDGFTFRLNPRGGFIRARIDFIEEYDSPKESEFAIMEVLHVEDESEGSPDIAFLRVAPRDLDDRELPPPIQLSSSDGAYGQIVGAVGYAAWDGDRNEREVMDRIFDGVYEVKRIHPGEIMEVHDRYLNHDCSTLGGNSGSVLLDFQSGTAVALHYAGRYEMRNYAVNASTVRAKLMEIGIDISQGV
jgi:endonuclease G